MVREPNGPALAGVTVRAWGLAGGLSNNYGVASTKGDGRYAISIRPGDTLSFAADGFVTKTWRVPAAGPANGTLDLEMKLQRALTVSVVAPLSSVLTNDDVTYRGDPDDGAGEGDYVCGPCKAIRLNRPDSTPMIVRLTWSGDLPLNLWVGDGWGVSQFHTARAGESELTALLGSRFLSQVLIGMDARARAVTLGDPVTFTLSAEPSEAGLFRRR